MNEEKNRILRNAGLLTEVEVKFHIDVPPEITTINNAFKKHGKKMYLVGGCVRDAVVGVKPKDFDISTSVRPEEVQKILSDSGIKNIPIGEAFAVISAIVNGEEFEIATFREDDYSDGDGRRPTSIRFTDMNGDAKRRDATLNALYYDIDEGKIIDLVGGLEDLKNKKIKPVGSPFERIEEDKLRSLRYIRFSNRFDSKLDEDTIKAIKHFKDLPGVSNERIRDEFLKGIISAKDPKRFLNNYKEFGLFNRIFPSVSLDHRYESGQKDPILVLAKLLSPNNEKDVEKALVNFKAHKPEKDQIKFLHAFENRFKDFEKITFIPSVDGAWLDGLSKHRDLNNINDKVVEWAKINGIDANLTSKFLQYKPKYSAKDFPDLEGKELGQTIKTKNAEVFVNSL